MIITQSVESMKGRIIYRLWDDGFSVDDGSIEEYDDFDNLETLLTYMKQNHLDEVATESGGYTNIKIHSIVFYSNGETSNIRVLLSSSIKGSLTTTIDNQNVDNRLLHNLTKVKEIVDNALEGYPIAY